MSRKLRRLHEKTSKRAKRANQPASAAFMQAVKFFQGRHFLQALDLCRKILESEPDNADALGLGGMAAFHEGDMDLSVKFLQKAAAFNQGDAESHNNLGVVLQAMGKTKEASDSFQKAVKINPQYVEALNNLGVQLHKLKKLDEAVNVLRQAIRIDPGYWIAHNSLGNALVDQVKFAEADACFCRAIALCPNYVTAYSNLAATLMKLEKPAKAEAVYRKVLKIDPRLASAHDGLGNALMDLERVEEAKAAYLGALEIDPNNANTHHNLGIALQAMGRLEDAEQSFRQALSLDPKNGNSYRHLTMTKKINAGDKDIKIMIDLLSSFKEDSENVMHLCFALGKALDDIGDYDQAFACFARGNRIKRAALNYDVSSDENLAAEIALRFNLDFITSAAKDGFASEIPVFVLGMPRSGTTLIEQIISSHSQAHGAGEIEDFRLLAEKLGPDKPSELGRLYVEALRRRAPQSLRITDKMPGNFFHVGRINMALPKAKIIHCVRDAADVCFSCFTQYFTARHDYAYDLTDLGRYWRMYARLMDHWRSVLPGVMLDVRYEDVINDQEAETKRVLDFCGLPWEDACLDFHKAKRSVRTASLAQVRRPVYKGSVRRWERYQKHLGPLLSALGEKIHPL